MDATADYVAARAALARALPAYVSYRVQLHVAGLPLARDGTSTIVVRSRDGKIVKGTRPGIKFDSGSSHDDKAVPFDAACYHATSARHATFDGRPVEALSLKFTCNSDAREGDFDTLYLDAGTREPLAVVGDKRDDPVTVHIEQTYAHVGPRVLPATLDVAAKGTGLMFWLNVTARETFSHYGFLNTPPP